ncbi:MAG: proton-conducting transporter membrane subunit [Candidatus Bathyarchaeia archaeon]|jgi:multicomponent Na+:H+ antiporter subunit D
MIYDWTMLLATFFPGFVGAFAVLLLDLAFKNKTSHRSAVSGIVALVTFGFIAYSNWQQATQILASGKSIVIQLEPSILATTFTITELGVYISSIALLLSFMISVYSIAYLRKDGNSAVFQSLILLLYLSIYAVTVSGDLLTFFIGWEGMSVAAYGLVAFYKHSWEAIEATVKYLIMSGIGSLTALYGIALIYGLTGSLNIESFVKAFATPTPIGDLALVLIFMGFGVEAAIAPLHMWLPDAHPAAPSPMSALLSGIIIEVGSFAFIRLLGGILILPSYVAMAQPILAITAVATMFIGNLSALQQDDLKRLLAYSSIAQVGYILLGIATLTAAGFSASVFHIWNHALLKGLLFLLAGIVTFQIGTRSLSEMAGLGRKSPILAALFSFGALAMTGVPPFGLFWSEFLIVLSNLAVGSLILTGAVVLMLVNLLISIGYYFRVIRTIAFAEPSSKLEAAEGSMRIPVLLLIPCVVLVGLSLITGLYPNLFYQAAADAVKALLAGF